MVLAFHGKAQDGKLFEAQTQLTEREFNEMGAVVVFPEGMGGMWMGDPEAPPRRERDDIAFGRYVSNSSCASFWEGRDMLHKNPPHDTLLSHASSLQTHVETLPLTEKLRVAQSLLEHVTKEYCVDLSRFYIVGFSNGGGLTTLLACDPDFSAHIAAAAIVSGAVYKDKSLKGDEPIFDVCKPAWSPLPILEMHGSKDPVIHYDGKSTPDGETYPIGQWVAGWRERNGCGGEMREEAKSIHGGSVAKTSWYCGDEEVVNHFYIEGFGHGWPSTRRQEDDGQRYGPLEWNGTKDIVDFLKSKTLPAGEHAGKIRDEL